MRLSDRYDVLLLDLDGTLYRGGSAIQSAVTALEHSTLKRVYVTNNASRSAVDVARHLTELGFRADAADVAICGQAAAKLLTEHLEPGQAVLVVGTEALAAEVAAAGFRPTRSAADDPAAVVQGHSPTTAWPVLAEASYAIRAGALWIAANTDTTLPTERGFAPGNGSMVAALHAATEREPLVAGKPFPPLFQEAMRRAGNPPPERVLVVGDRLDTDIEGAHRAGLDSLLVLTGVNTREDLRTAPENRQPTYVAEDLTVLDEFDTDR